MRSFSETLPTLREAAPSPSAPASLEAAFDPGAILKALRARPVDRPGHVPLAVGAEAASPSEPRRALRADELRRKRETSTSARPFKMQLEDAIEPFDQPAARHRSRDAPDPAEEKTREEAAAAREKAVEAARAEERQKAEAMLASERVRWAEETAEKLSADIDQAFVDLHNRLADAITLALTPVLEEAMRTKAVNRFSGSLERLMGRHGASGPLVIRGSQELLDALKTARAGDTAGLKLVASDDSELVASVNDTTLRTTIKAWATALAAAAGSRHG